MFIVFPLYGFVHFNFEEQLVVKVLLKHVDNFVHMDCLVGGAWPFSLEVTF